MKRVSGWWRVVGLFVLSGAALADNESACGVYGECGHAVVLSERVTVEVSGTIYVDTETAQKLSEAEETYHKCKEQGGEGWLHATGITGSTTWERAFPERCYKPLILYVYERHKGIPWHNHNQYREAIKWVCCKGHWGYILVDKEKWCGKVKGGKP